MHPLLYVGAGIVALHLMKKKDTSTSTPNGTPPSSRTTTGFPAGQPGAPVLNPPGTTGAQIGVALAQNSGTIATGLSSAAASIFDWARAGASAAQTGDSAAEAANDLALSEGDDDAPLGTEGDAPMEASFD